MRRLHEWAADTATGDRDELVPGVEDRAWRQVSVSATECLGAQRCPFGVACFAERAREAAGRADIVVTNHALLAIDALEEFAVLPEHDVVIIDEAHDLVEPGHLGGIRGAVGAGDGDGGPALRPGAVGRGRPTRCGRRRRRPTGCWRASRRGRIDDLPAPAGQHARRRPRRGRGLRRTGAGRAPGEAQDDAERLAAGRAALAALDEVSETADRMLGAFGPDVAARRDVVWMDRPADADRRRPPTLRVAPLEVGALLADRLFRRQTVVLTSATLALGGSFEPLARQWGLPAAAVSIRREPSTGREPSAAVSRPPAVGHRRRRGNR